MRRFIASLPGRFVSHLVVLALLLPYLALTLINKAEAQAQVQPTLAVTEFNNLRSPGTNFGQLTARAFMSELTKVNKYDVQGEESVTRALAQLELSSPVTGNLNLLRLAGAMGVSTIVTGDLVDYTVRTAPGGKQGLVSLRVIFYDVASGLPINGASLVGQSTVRGGDVKDETLIVDAINAAASQAVRDVSARSLPVGTILNTLPDSALVNKGTRDGFKAGQEVIILRGREQVASGKVTSVDFDSATVAVTRQTRGVKPEDRVRVLYTPPPIIQGFNAKGEARLAPSAPKGVSSAVVTTLLLIGLLAVLLSGKNASSQDVASLKSEASVDSVGSATVTLSWAADAIGAGGNSNRVAWQVWRHDVLASPIYVVSGGQTGYTDTTATTGGFTWTLLGGKIGGTTCDNTDYNDETADATIPGISPGIPYLYQLNLVYSINSNDLPGGDSSSSSSGSSGTTSLCYFVSEKSTAQGYATPINRPVLSSPADGASPNSTTFFSVTSPFANAQADVNAEYILQFSPTYQFTKSSRYNAVQWFGSRKGTVQTPTAIDLTASEIPSFVKNADFYWRIGVRNANDNPGPKPDPTTGERFVFSLPNKAKRQITP